MGKKIIVFNNVGFLGWTIHRDYKKIKSQIKVFLKQGYEVDYTYISDNYVWIYEKGIRHKIGKTKIEENFQPICTWQIILEIRDMILFIIAMDYLTPFFKPFEALT